MQLVLGEMLLLVLVGLITDILQHTAVDTVITGQSSKRFFF